MAIHAPHREGGSAQPSRQCPDHHEGVDRSGADRQDPRSRCRQHGGPEIEVLRGYWADLQNHAFDLAGQEERVDHRSLEAQREEALDLGNTLKAEELDREPERKLGPAANAIERRAQLVAEAEGREYEPLTQWGARVHAVRQAKAMFAEMRERLELARDAWAEAREEGHGHVSAGLAALRAAAGRQAKELAPDEIKQRLARIAGREQNEEHDHTPEQGSRDIRGRLADVLGKAKAKDQEREKDRQ
ncbi:MobA/MobL family protein [Tabrizicola sp.]|uniref:MobA/MobL family protein n=1 Tax=Tabrizicola sp. TaxID=2005166 RepID=UPI0035B31E49